ncbi:MAG: CpaF family protein [Deltaproteobacteria bacterium]|nr:MAG: CpaF family protein [Deltaproteobacteria bacterium]
MGRTPPVQRIAHLLDDPEVTEIMINGPRHVFVEKGGIVHELESPFQNQGQLTALVDALVVPSGRAVTTMQPFVDFRMPDGSRVNIVIAPVALDGPVITIRRATASLTQMADLVRLGTLTEQMAYFCFMAIKARLNIVFSGASGSGKTTTLGLMSAYIPEGERIVLIEDTAELQLQQSHVVRLECRPPNIEGSGAIPLSDLLRNSFRMRPNRIIVGEVRGPEAVEMLQAMTSGHDGCLAVLHAGTPRHALSRLEMMVLSKGLPLPLWGIQRQIGEAVDVIIQLALMADGSRRVTHITEVIGVGDGGDDGGLETEDLYLFEHGVDESGAHHGHFRCTGVRPRFYDRLARVDPKLTEKLFVAG